MFVEDAKHLQGFSELLVRAVQAVVPAVIPWEEAELRCLIVCFLANTMQFMALMIYLAIMQVMAVYGYLPVMLNG
ncbi:hypothetical protein TUM19329_16910 [Legionella antarctica]|uniref:Uncharacterized protein n=1 Tax=Legionella antarctica TaxID=2708020 RepID=A0A6F8T5A1_9GAMM|nr:hypothetical protein TUM19329_16910 [Legionella antarctica]